jgi:hypothetical protein
VAPDVVDLIAGPGADAFQGGQGIAEHVGARAGGADDNDGGSP